MATDLKRIGACYAAFVGKKTSLPLLPDAWTGKGKGDKSELKAKKPSLDDARNRLGGRTTDEEPAPPGMFPCDRGHHLGCDQFVQLASQRTIGGKGFG